MSGQTISEDLRRKVHTIVADVLEVDAGELVDSSSFSDDFDADSLMTIEIIARFERDLGITVPQDEMVDLDDLSTAYALAARYAKEPTSA
ncbi:phosphopantetheine-binding protein [Allonocardiopsis opalescens]|uniref:Acyl carrier protein n=1 Tax=Allonocardiopsis opalescens TaxID=1144618 RepID=A0A2T0PUK5_9ACTN|nr:phosphopantetheine-binding protein [Allonocardiopsis opalescens]PRX92570.1 acyl carrier protein [Allonocardiopsis opalescens]